MSKQARYIKLGLEEIHTQLGNLPIKWQLSSTQKAISTQLKFNSFEDTWAYLMKISLRSHLTQHHPTITTTYNEVGLLLTTHDIDGLSDIDFKLAKRFSNYAINMNAEIK